MCEHGLVLATGMATFEPAFFEVDNATERHEPVLSHEELVLLKYYFQFTQFFRIECKETNSNYACCTRILVHGNTHQAITLHLIITSSSNVNYS